MSDDHEAWCKTRPHTDAAKRLYDTYNLHYIVKGPTGVVGKWFAVSLADGTGDNVLYDSKRDCVIHQHHNEQYFAFVRMVPSMMRLCEAEVMLSLHRRLYDSGMRLTDPDDAHGGKDVITRLTVEDQLAQSRGQIQNLFLPGRN